MPNEHNATTISTSSPLQTTIGGLQESGPPLEGASAVKNEQLMEICDVVISEDTLFNSQLVQRLAYASLEQVLFFTNQIPLPIAKLASLRDENQKASRKRDELLKALGRLKEDINMVVKRAAESDVSLSPAGQFRMAIVLGSLSIPKRVILFDTAFPGDSDVKQPGPASDTREACASSPVSWTINNPATAGSDLDHTESHPFPPDSDDESSIDEHPQIETSQTSQRAEMLSQKAPPRSFTPFSDDQTLLKPSGQITVSTSGHFRQPTVPPSPFANENARSNDAIQKQHASALRSLIVGIGNMNTFVEEADASKIHIYVQAARGLEHPAWLPRPAANKPFELLVSAVEHTVCEADCGHGTILKSKLSKMAACAIVVRPSRTRRDDMSSTFQNSQHLWFEWDGKLHGLD
ncbi:hypothetical protein PIIN_07703 [Serendipita indica DSM 11827]|uniref:Uncharacterized protein n=1 Tax=Serendipita indica (strain DSM 11827) TaxID=1109443 RepID=G4TR05_SERID|nr:hypothetical protein PIIN_07703 [Serendipita indica DSM 11827]